MLSYVGIYYFWDAFHNWILIKPTFHFIFHSNKMLAVNRYGRAQPGRKRPNHSVSVVHDVFFEKEFIKRNVSEPAQKATAVNCSLFCEIKPLWMTSRLLGILPYTEETDTGEAVKNYWRYKFFFFFLLHVLT